MGQGLACPKQDKQTPGFGFTGWGVRTREGEAARRAVTGKGSLKLHAGVGLENLRSLEGRWGTSREKVTQRACGRKNLAYLKN